MVALMGGKSSQGGPPRPAPARAGRGLASRPLGLQRLSEAPEWPLVVASRRLKGVARPEIAAAKGWPWRALAGRTAVDKGERPSDVPLRRRASLTQTLARWGGAGRHPALLGLTSLILGRAAPNPNRCFTAVFTGGCDQGPAPPWPGDERCSVLVPGPTPRAYMLILFSFNCHDVVVVVELPRWPRPRPPWLWLQIAWPARTQRGKGQGVAALIPPEFPYAGRGLRSIKIDDVEAHGSY